MFLVLGVSAVNAVVCRKSSAEASIAVCMLRFFIRILGVGIIYFVIVLKLFSRELAEENK